MLLTLIPMGCRTTEFIANPDEPFFAADAIRGIRVYVYDDKTHERVMLSGRKDFPPGTCLTWVEVSRDFAKDAQERHDPMAFWNWFTSLGKKSETTDTEK